jgi:hypothetical protein
MTVSGTLPLNWYMLWAMLDLTKVATVKQKSQSTFGLIFLTIHRPVSRCRSRISDSTLSARAIIVGQVNRTLGLPRLPSELSLRQFLTIPMEEIVKVRCAPPFGFMGKLRLQQNFVAYT